MSHNSPLFYHDVYNNEETIFQITGKPIKKIDRYRLCVSIPNVHPIS